MSRGAPLRADDTRLASVTAQLTRAPRAALVVASGLAESFPLDDRAQRLHGLALLACNEPRAGFEALTRAVAIDTQSAPNWLALASLYRSLDQREDVIASLRRAAAVAGADADAWQQIATLALAVGDVDLAQSALREVIRTDPARLRPRLDLASIELEAGQVARAEASVRAAVALAPEDADVAFVLGTVLGSQNKHAAAAVAYAQAVGIAPQHLRAWFNLGVARDEAREYKQAAAAFARVLEIDPDQHAARAHLLFLKRRLADWQGLEELSDQVRAAAATGAAGIEPFGFLAEPASPAEQLRCARTRAAEASLTVGAEHRPRIVSTTDHAPLRVGFVSSGFNQHPTAALIVELIERMRSSEVVTLGFATSAGDGGELRRRLRRGFHEFRDVSGLSMPALARNLASSGAEILIDLRGYGGGGVPEAFALRPAPIQVNWLAYPGTSGAQFVDYLIADRFVVPAHLREHYSEQVAWLPYCFQPSDSTRSIDPPPSRALCGLPATGVVFASFNNGYKIGPEPFAAWLEILAAVPGSVLWLLDAPEPVFAANLRGQASGAGLDPQRLRFQRKLPHSDYLARFAHVDLFLDTWPYNAHTTASDALWAGCPLLSWPGETFASRVAGSLLRTLGLGRQLVVDSRDAYIERAVQLGNEPEQLKALRAELARRRRIAPLFDMDRFAQHFAAALRHMSERHRAGQAPAHFAVGADHRIIQDP